MKRIKAILGWTILGALVVFALMNFQQAKISLFDVSLQAPLSYIIALAALLGALSRHAVVTAIGWAVTRATPDTTPLPLPLPVPDSDDETTKASVSQRKAG